MRRSWTLVTSLAAGASLLLIGVPGAGAGPGGPAFARNSRASVQSTPGWDEPAGIAAADGRLSMAFQNPNASPDSALSQSGDGRTWTADAAYAAHDAAKPEGDMGDVTMTSDRAGTIFVGHLTQALQTDIDYSTDGGRTWATASGVLGQALGSSTSAFLVDRPWIAAYSPDNNRLHTQVYLEYHDFGPSVVWVVSCSMATGSLSCGAPVPVSNPQTACNSVPGGVAVSPPGSRHPGRVYAVWSTADPLTNALSGCNYTQLAPFYAIYSSWSDTPTVAGSWHQSAVYVGPTGDAKCPDTAPVGGVSTATCADVSEIFTPVAVDTAGNAYVAFVDFIDTLDPHYDTYLATSTDGGSTWRPPIRVSDAGGTHFLPALVAGTAGRVAVGYYATRYADRPYETGDTCPVTAPPETSCQGKAQPEPPGTAWVYDVSESIDATAARPAFHQVQASDPGVVAHYGDICNLGIYCDGSSTGNRSVFDSTALITDAHGLLLAAWTDQRSDTNAVSDAGSANAQSAQLAYAEVWVAHQSGGPSLFAKG